MRRRSVVAGSFYPGSEKKLREMLDSFFTAAGGLPPLGEPRSVGGLSPHAGYVYSGEVAAFLYKEMWKNLPETFIVLGPNHTGIGSPVAVMTSGAWETPLGELPIDEEMAVKIQGLCEILDDDAGAHSQEHSIEVQLPFIQYIGGKKFVPICMGMQDEETASEVGTAIGKAADRPVGIVASSDLTHFGAGYGFLPTREDPLVWMEKTDGNVLQGIAEMAPEKVIMSSRKTTVCGYGCIAAMITACKALGLRTSEVLKYRTSYEVSRDKSFIVGYGAAVVR